MSACNNVKHGRDGPVPKYQNSFAFRHNKNSMLTNTIMAIPATKGLCRRCTNVVEWKRTYRKYKPLSRPRKCTGCNLPAVRLAYHVLCGACAHSKGVCAKCRCDRAEAEKVAAELDELNSQIATLKDTKGSLPGISERERRSMLRECLRERQRLMDGEGGDEDEEGEGAEAVPVKAKYRKGHTPQPPADDTEELDGEDLGDEEEGGDGDVDGEEEEGEEGEEEEEEEDAAPAMAPAAGVRAQVAFSGLDHDGMVDSSVFTRALQNAKARQAALG